MTFTDSNWLGTLFLSIAIASLWGCAPDVASPSSPKADTTSVVEAAPSGCPPLRQARSVKLGNSFVELRPQIGRYRGDILVLPAWGATRDACCRQSHFCNTALSKGYRLILPAMGKCIYAAQTYPETREDWKDYPGYPWLRDSLIPKLQDEFCMLLEEGNNFVMGLSSGARGAVRLAADFPETFVAIAGLSGDYNPAEMAGDNIYRGHLGSFSDFPKRWEETENLTLLANRVELPVFLGHGKNDALVPYHQTESFYNKLVRFHPDLKVELSLVEEQGDGFAYWNTEMNNIFRFFEDTQADRPESP